jgi:hypothetical protein
MNDSSLRIIVTGLIAQHPRLGGVAWDYLQYPLGLRLLGHDVYYFEDSGEWPYNFDGGATGDDWVARDCTPNVNHLRDVMVRIGLEDRWAYRFPLESRWYGLSDSKRDEVLRTADLLINISGSLERPDNYRTVGKMVYIDSDPVFTQVKIASGDEAFDSRVAAHDIHFSFGEELSEKVPKTRYNWLPTRQPVVRNEWQPVGCTRNVFSTIMSWTSYRPLIYRQLTYAQKDVEFRKFLELPSLDETIRLQIALGHTEHLNWSTDGDSGLSTPELLRRMGWDVVNAYEHCASLDSYRDFIRTASAEWSVAKNGYVLGQPGWFSCRSACYLAAGRPVVVQNTGFDRILPVKEGILAFSTVSEAVAHIREVRHNYNRHSKAALEIGAEYFDSAKVLTQLVNRIYSNGND